MEVYFSKFCVTRQVFFRSKYSYAVVNLKPIVPGHVLVVPLRVNVPRLADLTPTESADYFKTIQVVHRFIKAHYKAHSLNLAIQDGPELGQSIPHLHTHIIPRFSDDGYGDDIYRMIESQDLTAYYRGFEKRRDHFHGSERTFPEDEKRISRSMEEMEVEATQLRTQLQDYIAGLDSKEVDIPDV